MILYDQTRLGGYGVLLHAAGSCLFLYRTFLPALLSAALTVVCSEVEGLNAYLLEHVVQAAAYFGSISFLLGLMLVTRTTRALERFTEASRAVVGFQTAVHNCALAVEVWLPCEGESEEIAENRVLRCQLMRWLRALHVLAMEELQGISDSAFRSDTLTEHENGLLLYEHKKTARVLHWLFRAFSKERKRFVGVGDPIFAIVYKNLDDIHLHYTAALRVAETPYPFPLAQISVFICNMFAVLSPFVWGTCFPQCGGLAFFVAFSIVWIVFAANESAVSLESPYDDDTNDLPLAYYSLRFHDDLSGVEHASRPPMDLRPSIPVQELSELESADVRRQVKDKAVQDIAIMSLKKRLARFGGHFLHFPSLRASRNFTSGFKLPSSSGPGVTAQPVQQQQHQLQPHADPKNAGVINRVYALQDIDLTTVRMKGNYRLVR